MSKPKRKALNLNRETLRSLALDDVTGGIQLPNSLACTAKITKLIGDTVYRSFAQCPTINCSLAHVCA